MSSTIMRFDAIVTDMDGTLTDSEREHMWAYQEVLRSTFALNVADEEFDRFAGSTDLAVAEYLIQTYGLPIAGMELVERKEVALPHYLSAARPLPGVLDQLSNARDLGLKLAVASSATLAAIEIVLKALRVRDMFKVIASGQQVRNSKPAPDVFHLAARRLQVKARRCIAWEDSGNGTRAAVAAGMFCVAIACGGTVRHDLSAAHLRLASLEELDLRRLLKPRTARRRRR